MFHATTLPLDWAPSRKPFTMNIRFFTLLRQGYEGHGPASKRTSIFPVDNADEISVNQRFGLLIPGLSTLDFCLVTSALGGSRHRGYGGICGGPGHGLLPELEFFGEGAQALLQRLLLCRELVDPLV
jgi:hypothetical protein